MRLPTLLVSIGLGGAATAAELHPLFQDNAVLQCGRRVPVWGTGRDDENITVTFAGQGVSTVVASGKWQVWLEPMPPNSTPGTLTVAGDTTRILSNVLVGEVWVASGQSNMERQLGLRPGQPPITGWEDEVAAADHPQIRQFYVTQRTSFTPQSTVAGSWAVCSPETVVDFTAVGYFFARDLSVARKVPVGIIHSSWGGTPAEAWTSEAGLRSLPDFAAALAELGKFAAEPGLAQPKTVARVADAGGPSAGPGDDAGMPTLLYNGMIAPLLPYAIRGVIWYQGEANVGRERQYRSLFPAMIADWRRAWGQGEFPFLFVQIAPYRHLSPEIREAQLLAWQGTKNTAMAVTLDCGDADDIHPPDKRPVGARLALAARALAYSEKLEYSGPVFEAMATRGSAAVLRFTHAGGGLVAKDGELKDFTIAAADKVFHPAKAKILGDTIVVSADGVSEPVAVRYAWANVPQGNLYNRAGLPASPFRTDTD